LICEIVQHQPTHTNHLIHNDLHFILLKNHHHSILPPRSQASGY